MDSFRSDIGECIGLVVAFFLKYTSFNFWVATFYLYVSLLSPHSNFDAFLIIVTMALYYMWAKYDLEIA